jgi:hypothetical protein
MAHWMSNKEDRSLQDILFTKLQHLAPSQPPLIYSELPLHLRASS